MTITDEIKKKRSPSARFPVLDCIQERFSPRVFASTPISDSDLQIIFEAARLAPSGRNHQPWFYYWVRKGSAAFEKLKKCIPERNNWSLTARVVIIACYNPNENQNENNKWAQYDLGASVMSLILQAQNLGYQSRQIGSYDCGKTKELFSIPDPLIPFTLIAMGKIGFPEDYEMADKTLIEKELTSWSRKDTVSQELTE